MVCAVHTLVTPVSESKYIVSFFLPFLKVFNAAKFTGAGDAIPLYTSASAQATNFGA
jgi:hypothetical protein